MYKVPLFIMISDVGCVGHLNVSCGWFYARFTNTLEVGTFLQMWKLRHREGVTELAQGQLAAH